MNAMSPLSQMPSTTVSREIDTLSGYVRRVRSELAAVRPDALRDLHLARASDHLGAVEQTAETSATRILDACEQLEMFARSALADGQAQSVANSVTAIYEACNFHDLAAQRVRKVAETLDLIEVRLGWLARALGPSRDDAGQLARAVSLQIAANDHDWGCPVDQRAVDSLLTLAGA